MRASRKKGNKEEALKLYPDDEFREIYNAWCIVLLTDLALSSCSFEEFIRLKPYYVKTDHKQMCCVCVYHHGMRMHVNSLHRIRKQVHLSRASGSSCQFHDRCACECVLCKAHEWTSSQGLRNFLNSVMCCRVEGAHCYDLACVLGLCDKCGWDRVQGACEIEQISCEMEVSVSCLVEHTRVGSGQSKKVFKVEGTKNMRFGEYMPIVKSETADFLIHDHIMRMQGDLYHRMINSIPTLQALDKGYEVWVVDFIENFSCFSKNEMQQEYYNKISISIFIVLVIRAREAGEEVRYEEVAYFLPPHLTCDVHVFVSDDKVHDAGFATLSIDKVFQHTTNRLKARCVESDTPRKLKVHLWSDGAPNQFKWTLPQWFLSFLLAKYGGEDGWLLFVTWNFWVSCHGKGMQDAAGAWVKVTVARAVLVGSATIHTLRDFLDYCFKFLTRASASTLAQAKASFTSNRFFWLLTMSELASHRVKLPKVTCWHLLRWCYQFWATGEGEGHMGRRWLGCDCPSCMDGSIMECKRKHLYNLPTKHPSIPDGVVGHLNEPQVTKLTCSYMKLSTQEEQVSAAKKVKIYHSP